MLSFILFATAFVAANAQGSFPDYLLQSPKPYAFSYNSILDDGVGQSSRTETGDGSGRVQGSYTLNNDEGHSRVVEYVADKAGFRAVVRTNEPGTEGKNPADVVIESSAVVSPYAPLIRKPVLNAPVLAPVVEPAVVAAPVPVRPVYRRPVANPMRNYAFRPVRPY